MLPEYLGKAFSKQRSKTNLYADLTKGTPPTFHEVRGLGSRLLENMGWDKKNIQKLMTHTSTKTTEIYLSGGSEALQPKNYLEVETGLHLDSI